MSRPNKADLEAKIVQLEATVDRLRKERRALLSVESTDGLSCSEWVARTAKAEAMMDAYKKANENLAKSPYVQPEFGLLFTKHQNLYRSVQTALALFRQGSDDDAVELLRDSLESDCYPDKS